jgi:hypothetical protein
VTVKDVIWALEAGAPTGQMVNSCLVQKALEELGLRWDRIVDDNPIGYVHRVKLNRYLDWWRRNP